MILGIFLRHIKVYKGINFIPLSDGKSFCGLVGDNGVGKSSVLEALDIIFNNREWNINIEHNNSKSNEAYIVPIFCLRKDLVTEDKYKNSLSLIDNILRSIVIEGLSPKVITIAKKMKECLDSFIFSNKDHDQYYLVPLGITSSNNLTFGILNSTYKTQYMNSTEPDKDEFEEDEDAEDRWLDQFKDLFKYITLNLMNYIYIPKELSAEQFTKLHNKQFQSLMGKSLEETLSEYLTTTDIRGINTKLDSIIDGITSDLKEYEYRTEHTRQQKIKKADIYNLIIEAYFGIRHIHLKRKDGYILIDQLSSGEKQKAIINITHSLLEKRQSSEKEQIIILGVDEPESSLHISACFDIFQKIYSISRKCNQIIFTSHWYGFLPSVIDGNTTIISQTVDLVHEFDFLNISKYREETKQLIASSTKEQKLPSSIKLKSMNDLVQSIVCGSMGEEPFNWLICEGSSEKIYFNAFLKDLIESHKLRILPVGSYKEVKKLYDHLSIAFKEFKSEITGKVFLLIDTDINAIKGTGVLQDNEHPCLKFRRLALVAGDDNINCIEKIDTAKTVEATELEDVLHAATFKRTIEFFSADYIEAKNILEVIGEVSPDFYPSGWSINLSSHEKMKLMKNFFNLDNGGMKLSFAEKYIDLYQSGEHITWINEIRDFLIK